jgi:hypothetical protein
MAADAASRLNAGLLLQRFGRGLVGRRKFFNQIVAKLKVQRMVKRVRFAKRIQPVCKAYLARRDLIKNLREAAARPVKVLQRIGRAFRERREFAEDLAKWKARRRWAATVAQAFSRSQRSSRRRAIQFRRAALRLLQSVGRGLFGRRAAFNMIVSRLRRRKKQVITLQSVGRAYLTRIDSRYRRITQVRERRRVFVFETARFWKAYRIRLSLGRRRRVVLKANRQRLALLAQRVGQGLMERRFLEPRYRMKKHADWLLFCTMLFQCCGRGMRARAWLQHRYEAAQARIRRNRIKRQSEHASTLTLQRVGRAFLRRRRCFRRWYRALAAMRLLAACAAGNIARNRLRRHFHSPTKRVRAPHEEPEGDDDRALRLLRQINQALRDELMEEQWRMDTLLRGGLNIAASRVAVIGAKRARDPAAVYSRRIAVLQRNIAAARQQLGANPPERLASVTAQLTDVERQRAVLLREQRKALAEIASRAGDVADADRELEEVDQERRKAQAAVDKLRKRIALAEAVAAKAQREREELEVLCEGMELKLAATEDFEDEDRSTTPRSLRRRAQIKRLAEGAPTPARRSMAAGSPSNAAWNLSTTVSSVTPEPRVGHPEDDNRLTYHFDTDDDPEYLRRAATSLGDMVTGGSVASPPASVKFASTTHARRSSETLQPRRRVTALDVGICVPMVARFDYGAASPKGPSASTLRGATTSLAGSPIRSIRVKPSASLTPLMPDALNSTTGSSGAGSVYQPYVVVRTRTDMVYAKLQLAEADAKIAELKFDIQTLEKQLDITRERAEKARIDREEEDRRAARHRTKLQASATKEAQETAEACRLRERLEMLQAIARAEQEAADAAERRAKAEAAIKEQQQRAARQSPPPPPATQESARLPSDASRRASNASKQSRSTTRNTPPQPTMPARRASGGTPPVQQASVVAAPHRGSNASATNQSFRSSNESSAKSSPAPPPGEVRDPRPPSPVSRSLTPSVVSTPSLGSDVE